MSELSRSMVLAAAVLIATLALVVAAGMLWYRSSQSGAESKIE